MKKNRLMALTALLTLLGAPSSKAQEVKGDSKQPTSSQSANKDSKATDKTKEQVKNQGQNKDSKALQTKDSKTVDKTKEQTKDSNKDGKKEQDKGSKKDDKKQQTKNSNPAGSEANLVNRTRFGYTVDWIKKNLPWLTTIAGTGAVSGYIGNKMGKKANVTQMDNNTIKQKAGALGMIDKTNEGDVKQAAAVFGIKYTEMDLNNKAQTLAGGKKYTDEELNNKVNEEIDQKIGNKELVKNNKNDVKQAAEVFGIKYTDEDLNNKAQTLASGKKYTEVEFNSKVGEEIDKKIGNKELIKANDEDAVRQAAESFGIKYTDNEVNTKIANAVLAAKHKGLLERTVKEEQKTVFDNSTKDIDKKLSDSLKAIQIRLSGNFVSILAKTKYGEANKEAKINNETILGALYMLADIRNALVDKQAVNFKAQFADTEGKKDNAWSDFYFDLGSKHYNVYMLNANGQTFYVTDDNNKTRYAISLY